MHHEAVAGNLDAGEEMAGPFAALHAVAHLDRAVRAGDLEGHGAAEAGTFEHCLLLKKLLVVRLMPKAAALLIPPLS